MTITSGGTIVVSVKDVIVDVSIAGVPVGNAAQGFGTEMAASADRAWQFIRAMMRSAINPVSDAVIRPDSEWPRTHQGAVSGTFDIPMKGEPTHQPCPLKVDSPTVVPDSYRGIVTGSLLIPPGSGMTVKCYLVVDQPYEQPPIAAVNPTTGAWSLDLSSVSAAFAGSWGFALWQGGAQVGDLWPSPYGTSYTNIFVEHNVIEDDYYPVGTRHPAEVSGRFRFDLSLMGRKNYRLVRPGGQILADHTPSTGCVRSYLPRPGEDGYGTSFMWRSFSYDQAMCLIAAIEVGDRESAASLARGLLHFQTETGGEVGGFYFSATQLAPDLPGEPQYRTGTHCFCTYALLKYHEAWPEDVGQDFVGAITAAVAWLDRYLRADGLYGGGRGQSGNPAYLLPFAATEHNVDAWHLWDLAYDVFGTSTYLAKRDNLRTAIMTNLWDTGLGRFRQGVGPAGEPDTADPLDCHSWGAMFLVAIGELAKAQQIMTDEALAPFAYTYQGVSGYGAYYAGGGYPDATPTVWSEGTFGVALAFLALGDHDRWAIAVQGMMAGQEADGAYRYAVPKVVAYEMTDARGVIGGAWAVLAQAGHGIWRVGE